MKKIRTRLVKEKTKLSILCLDENSNLVQPTLVTIIDVRSRLIVGYTLIRPEGKVTRMATHYIDQDC